MCAITTLHDLNTEYAADSIEWCPHPNYNKYFVCGTYELENNVESSTKFYRRKGRIYSYEFNKSTKLIEKIECLETAAILDMKWLIQLPAAATVQSILGVANALGEINICQLNAEKHLEKVTSLSLDHANENLLALSLDWSNLIATQRLLSSDSSGYVHLINLSTEGAHLSKEYSWKAHDYEAWICTFDKWNHNIFYSGGDDTLLNVYDLRTSNRTLCNKCHNAGVTSLLSHPLREHILLTGSYDDCLRIFDTRAMRHQLFELKLGGGIWRLKADPLDGNLILAACMYHNFSVIDIKNVNHLPEIIGEINVHTSICYGADWCMDVQPHSKQLFMATCSFYDRKLCISELFYFCWRNTLQLCLEQNF